MTTMAELQDSVLFSQSTNNSNFNQNLQNTCILQRFAQIGDQSKIWRIITSHSTNIRYETMQRNQSGCFKITNGTTSVGWSRKKQT